MWEPRPQAAFCRPHQEPASAPAGVPAPQMEGHRPPALVLQPHQHIAGAPAASQEGFGRCQTALGAIHQSSCQTPTPGEASPPSALSRALHPDPPAHLSRALASVSSGMDSCSQSPLRKCRNKPQLYLCPAPLCQDITTVPGRLSSPDAREGAGSVRQVDCQGPLARA